MAKKKVKNKAKKKPAPKPKPNKVSWLAKGYPVLSSVTVLDDCAGAIDWYKKVLGARQRLRLEMPGGTVAHCELGFGDGVLMLGSPMPPQFPPKTACLGIYVKDCDAIFQKALSAGARALIEPADQFYGDRSGRFVDPYGNEWIVTTHNKDVSEKEMKQAMAQRAGA
jgi:PhnB protein